MGDTDAQSRIGQGGSSQEKHIYLPSYIHQHPAVLCRALETEGIDQSEGRMAAGELLLKSVLAAGSVHKVGSSHPLWAPFLQ